MSSDIFDYDVFLSFASSDVELVKPVWQELCLSGLRVFWSDENVKNELGNSWFDTIESSLDRSRHMLLVCSPASMNSTWVKREYKAFLDYCYKPGVRRLIPILVQGYQAKDLPLFLREIEAKPLGEVDSLKHIISILGGVNTEQLKEENRSLKQSVESLYLEKQSLVQEVKELKNQLRKGSRNKEATRTAKHEDRLETDSQSKPTVEASSEKLGAFEFLGLATGASSQEISQKYESLKREYQALLRNCPKGLKEVCELRLQELQKAYESLYFERKAEEFQKLEDAYELMQLPKGTVDEGIITDKYKELKSACLEAKQSSDKYIKEAATKELEKLEEAFLILKPKENVTTSNSEEQPLIIEVMMPHLSESITEATITKWFKKEGEKVERDEPLFEISTDKVDAEIPSPAAGILKKILFVEGETVNINTTIAHLE